MKKDIHILVTLDLSEAQRAQLSAINENIHVSVVPANNPKEVLQEHWAQAEVLYTQGTLPDPDKVPNLQWIQFHSAGIDNYVDHPLLRKKDIIATSMSGVITSQIAEYVLMAMLAFGQRLPALAQFQKTRKWPSEGEKRQRLLPQELRHSTVGILGYGSIGRQVARLLQPFEATILAAKKDVMHPEDKGYIPDGMGDPHGDFFDRLYPIEALHSLLRESDFVVVSLPLTDETHHILDARAFEVMKPAAYLVNVGRGELIDQAALVQALRNKHIAGAALDVFEEEPLPEKSPLWDMHNVIISPHVSGLSQHLGEETLSLFIENINRFMVDLPLYNRIDVDAGY